MDSPSHSIVPIADHHSLAGSLKLASGITAPITHVIFDMDGLMLDTESIYKEVYGTVVQRYGKLYDSNARTQYMGMSDLESAKAIIRIFELPITPQQFLEDTNAEAIKRVPDCQLMPGFERLHMHLNTHGIPTALATSTIRPTFELKTQNHEKALARFTHIVVGGSDPEVTMCKPAPDIFLVAARRFSDSPIPSQCLVFEDAAAGVQAAIAAGMPVVAVPDPEIDPTLFQGATLVLSSLEEFKPELFGLPPY